MVYGSSLKYLRNSEQAEEVTQEVFLKVYSKIQTLKSSSHLKGWILRITANMSCDFYNKQKKANEIQSKMKEELKVEKSIAQKEEGDPKMDLLRAALTSLSAEDNEIMMMHYFSELKVAEVAESMNMGVSAVKMRLHRGREKILSIMEQGK